MYNFSRMAQVFCDKKVNLSVTLVFLVTQIEDLEVYDMNQTRIFDVSGEIIWNSAEKNLGLY